MSTLFFVVVLGNISYIVVMFCVMRKEGNNNGVMPALCGHPDPRTEAGMTNVLSLARAMIGGGGDSI